MDCVGSATVPVEHCMKIAGKNVHKPKLLMFGVNALIC